MWSTGNPPVEMRHIFCGEIVNFKAQGLHNLNTATNWNTCAATDRCQVFPNRNGYCGDVFIRDSRDASLVLKESGSTLWPTSLSPVQLVPMFQTLYNRCPPATNNAALCFPDCHWRGNTNGFDIVIGTGTGTITTAYPASQGTCKKHSEWQDCDTRCCQQL